MKAHVDSKLLKFISANSQEKNPLQDACIHAGILKENQHLQIVFGWPAFLEYIGLESLLESLPKFDELDRLYTFLVSTLSKNSERDLLIHLYDELFVQCLTQVRELPQIDPAFLIAQIKKTRQFTLYSFTNEMFSFSLEHFEKLLAEQPYKAIHDLTLYLAWDRMCVKLAIIFEHVSLNPNIKEGLQVLRECLIESFIHITEQRRTVPSLFRLIEALYAFEMREETLQSHSDADWEVLCKSASALRVRENLLDIFYIDSAICTDPKGVSNSKDVVRGFTMDSADQVQTGIALAQFMFEKLGREISEWKYTLCHEEVYCLREAENGLHVAKVLHF